MPGLTIGPSPYCALCLGATAKRTPITRTKSYIASISDHLVAAAPIASRCSPKTGTSPLPVTFDGGYTPVPLSAYTTPLRAGLIDTNLNLFRYPFSYPRTPCQPKGVDLVAAFFFYTAELKRVGRRVTSSPSRSCRPVGYVTLSDACGSSSCARTMTAP